jgi:phosphate-selective porin OprO/OprP
MYVQLPKYANYVHTSFDTPIVINSKSSDKEDAVTMRAQYDF